MPRVKTNPGTTNWALEYIIDAQEGSQQDSPFPQVLGAFNINRAALYSPLAGQLVAGQEVPFKLAVPGASQVLMAFGEDFIGLHKNSGYFSAQVKIPGNSPTVTVCALFPNQSSEFEVLLEYQIK